MESAPVGQQCSRVGRVLHFAGATTVRVPRLTNAWLSAQLQSKSTQVEPKKMRTELQCNRQPKTQQRIHWIHFYFWTPPTNAPTRPINRSTLDPPPSCNLKWLELLLVHMSTQSCNLRSTCREVLATSNIHRGTPTMLALRSVGHGVGWVVSSRAHANGRTGRWICKWSSSSSSSSFGWWDVAVSGGRRFGSKARDRAANQLEFERMVRGLAVFQEREGHLAVPHKFVVPKEEEEEESVAWPEETRGMALGRKFHFVSMNLVRGLQDPHKRQLLASVGVPVDDWSEYKWKTVTLPALQTYKRLHGDLMVLQAFVVPSGDAAWPRATWGQPLGHMVSWLRMTRPELSVDRVKALDEMGFVWDVSAFKWQHQVFPALVEYKKRFGDVKVPETFVVPRDDESWPEELRGIKLGNTVNCIRIHRVFMSIPGAEDQLNEIGFDWSIRQSRFDDEILPSLETFKQLHGHCRVPLDFVVPSETPWPTKAWALKLGKKVLTIRLKACFMEQISANQERWDVLEFDWDPLTTRFEELVLPSLETFKQVHGHVKVPTKFVVPSKAPWPNKTWGFRLGQTVTNIRFRGNFKDQISANQSRWDALGFESTSRRRNQQDNI